MKSFKMKALAVAALGLAGLGMAGSAFAVCPTFSTAALGSSSPGGGGAWSSQTIDSSLPLGITPSIAGGAVGQGLNNSSCKLSFTINAGAPSNTLASVSDTSPQNEARYRARFYFDISALDMSGSNGAVDSTAQAKIYDVFATTSPGVASTDEVIIRLIGNAPALPFLRFSIADNTVGAANKLRTVSSATLPASASGHYYVEFDLNQGTKTTCAVTGITAGGGCFRYWIRAEGGAAVADNAADSATAVDNSGWSGAKQANLGLYATAPTFRTTQATKVFSVDEFDSRRQTFIGF